MSREKVVVVPFPIPDACYKSLEVPETMPGIAQPFVFYPAQFWAHKNHVVLIQALRYLREEKGIKVNCYFVGSDQGNQAYVQKRIDESRLDDQIRILGFVDDVTLRYLYKNALALAYVSLLGPNNLPPIEAAALGCPVIISDLPGHREQMREAALFVDATSRKAVGDTVARLLADSHLGKELAEKGVALATKLKGQPYFASILKIIDDFALLRNCWE